MAKKKKVRYRCRVKPSCILPPDLVRGFYERDPDALREAEAWVEKNGLIILFTNHRAWGQEEVKVHPDGYIYVEWCGLPPKRDMLRWLAQSSPEYVVEAASWKPKKIFAVYAEKEISFDRLV